MSISAMKQALEALERGRSQIIGALVQQDQDEAITALRQAIAEAEKQEPVAIGEEWKPCVKLPIIVHVREQRKGETHVSTREGITPVKEDDLIMRGVAGEEYPIGRELFNRTYTFDTAPVHASDISQERVDETAKHGHEPVAWREVVGKTTKYYDYNEEGRGEPLYAAPQPDLARVGEVGVWGEWVGLTREEFEQVVNGLEDLEDCWIAIEAKLKEKNCG